MASENEQPVAKSLSEIATMMSDNAAAARQARVDANSPNKEQASAQDEAISENDDSATGVDDKLTIDSGANDASVKDADGEHSDADGGLDADESSELELQAEQDHLTQVGNEDGLLEVDIDDTDLVEIGEETISLGDLKKFYKADKTILTAVEEAEAGNRDASITLAKAQEDSGKAAVAMNAMLEHVSNIVAQPLVGVPNEALKSTDPAAYIQQLELYNKDQSRIQQAQATLVGALQAHADEEKNLTTARKQHELQLLTQSIPALKDPAQRATASQDILDAGAHYGFSPDEINNAIDHRVYRMAHDAQQYRKLMRRSGENIVGLVEDAKTTVKKQTRTLRSRSTTAKNRLTAQAKQQKVLRTKAQKTGNVKDVAAFMAAKSR